MIDSLYDMFTVTLYERSQRHQVLDLVFKSKMVYTHLDWHDVSQWLDTPQAVIYVAWQQQKIVGVLATSPSLNGTCWMRLFAVDDTVLVEEMLPLLWGVITEKLRDNSVKMVAVLVIEAWLLDYLPPLGFTYDEDIITLSRSGHFLPQRRALSINIRNVYLEDLKTITAIDHQAFREPWQMTMDEIHQARRIASQCTLAMMPSGEVIAYQLSTTYNQNGHLARLAVLPAYQGSGVGGFMLDDLIRRFLRRGVRTITVNTQSHNVRSQRLYERYGFERNGYDLPVWIVNINP